MAKDLTAALQALTEEARGQTSRIDRALPAVAPASAIPARSGTALPTAGAGQGIASPLTEADYALREWHPEKNITSTDGIFTLKLKPIKKLIMTDALGGVVVFNYLSPP